MESDLIYAKTTSGEEAMLQRTRVMQRNVRMVLILVDGQSTVADLCAKTGNQQLTENALSELEKGGFVEPRVEQDSLWEESKKVAQEIRAAAIEQISQFSLPGAKEPSVSSEPSEPESRVFVHSVFPIPPRNDSPISQFSLAPMPSVRVAAEDIPPDLAQAGAKQYSMKRLRRSKKPGSSFVKRFKELLPSKKRKIKNDVSFKPIRRGQRYSMGWPALVISGILGVLALAFLTISFFPYDHYLPEVEAAFTQASGRPVKVGTMHVVVYPKPGLLLGDVRIGTGKAEIRIVEMRLQPVLGTLTKSKKTFREVALSGVTLPAELIAGLPSVFVAAAKPTARAGVEHISFEKTDVSFGGLGFSGMEGEAKLSADGLFQSLLLHTPDRSLSLEAKPVAQRLDVTLEGFGWRPSLGSPFLFDSVNLKGNLENGVFTIRSMELRLFDGLIQGFAILQADKKPSVSGEILFERLNATRLGDALGIGQQFSGETGGKVRFSSTSDSWPTIFSGINADGDFSMRRGSIRGIDLTEALRRVSSTPVQGGATVFEQLSGKVKLVPTSYQFSGLVLNSGLMQSTGSVEISQDLNVIGKMEVRMRGTVNKTRVPISISGPLKAPAVQIGRG